MSVETNSSFMEDGGTDYAPLSTSTNVQVALKYSHFDTENAMPVLLRFRTSDFMNQAVDISYLSCFPAEEERIYPPLTYLKPRRKECIRIDLEGQKRTVDLTIVTVVPHF